MPKMDFIVLRLVSFVYLVSFAFSHNAAAANDDAVIEGEVVVRFAKGTTKKEMQAAAKKLNGKIVRFYQSSASAHVKFPNKDSASLMESMALLESSDNIVKHVTPNYRIEFFVMPDDPGFSRQYHHKNIRSQTAWDIARGSKEIKVAVIDSGVDYTHRDLVENYYINTKETGLDSQGRDKSTNGIDDDNNGYVDDYRGWDFGGNDNDPMDKLGHGTHCAGNVGAKGNDYYGVVGVNWDVSIMGLKIGFSNDKGGSYAAAIAAIEYATAQGADVISASWGGPMAVSNVSQEDPLREAIAAAGRKGILFVAAAGNAGQDNDGSTRVYPASYDLDNIITVAAGNKQDKLAWFSNYGAESVDIMAPGDSILSTSISQIWDRRTHKVQSGTSMATPLVAGAAALLKSENPALSAVELKEILMETADILPGLSGKVKSAGRLNLYRALVD